MHKATDARRVVLAAVQSQGPIDLARFVERVGSRPGGHPVDAEFNLAVYLKVNLDLLFNDLQMVLKPVAKEDTGSAEAVPMDAPVN